MDGYDPADNARKCYDLAISTMREKLASFRREVIGDCVLYNADCREVLPLLPKVDAVVTDPQYGIKRDKGMGGGGGGFYEKRLLSTYAGDWDAERPAPDVFAAILNAAPVHIVWGGNYFTDALPVGHKWLFWDKCQTMPSYSDGEMAWTSLNGVAIKKFVYSNNGLMAREKGRVHPTQKPIDVMRWCLEQLPEDAQTILDPFMGSGTTAVACVKMGRKFIGIEIDEKYFDIACKRISDAYKQPDLFVAPPAPSPTQALMEF